MDIVSTATRFIGALLSGLKWVALSIFGRVMGGAGLAFANFQYAMPQVKQWLMDHASALSPAAQQFMGACGIDVFMVLVVSALIAKVGFKAVLTMATSLQGLIAQEP